MSKKSEIIFTLILGLLLVILAVFLIVQIGVFALPLYISIPIGLGVLAGIVFYCIFIVYTAYEEDDYIYLDEPADLMLFGTPGLKHWARCLGHSLLLCYYDGGRAIAAVFSHINAFLAIPLLIACAAIAWTMFILLPVCAILASAVHLLLFLSIAVVVWTITFVFWCIEMLYMKLHRLSSVCPTCHSKYTIPSFACPNCGEIHKRLVPNRFGVLHHVCDCGSKIPSSVLSGRFKLEARCPDCGRMLDGAKARHIAFQLVGAKGVGKTAFTAAFVHSFKDRIIKEGIAKASTPSFYSEQEQQAERWFNGEELKSTEGTNAIVYPLLIQSGLSVDRQVEIYDVSGSAFDGPESAAGFEQKQFGFCDGFLFLIDPTGGVKAHASKTKQENAVNGFINTLIANGHIRNNSRSNTPLSVVITKVDNAQLFQHLSPQTVENRINTGIRQFPDEQSARDDYFREYLSSVGYSLVVQNLEMQFSNIHYFAVSAIGHAENGSTYRPFGILKTVEWMMPIADPEFTSKVLMMDIKRENA